MSQDTLVCLSRSQRRPIPAGPFVHRLPHHPAVPPVHVSGARQHLPSDKADLCFTVAHQILMAALNVQAFGRREAALHDLSQGTEELSACQSTATAAIDPRFAPTFLTSAILQSSRGCCSAGCGSSGRPAPAMMTTAALPWCSRQSLRCWVSPARSPRSWMLAVLPFLRRQSLLQSIPEVLVFTLQMPCACTSCSHASTRPHTRTLEFEPKW